MRKNYDYDDYDSFNEEEESQQSLYEEHFGCGFCWDKKKKKNKELFFIDNANNMRVCNYCPYCGRKY